MSEKVMTVAELVLALSNMPQDAEIQMAIWRNAPGGGRDILRVPVESVDLHPEGKVVVAAHEKWKH